MALLNTQTVESLHIFWPGGWLCTLTILLELMSAECDLGNIGHCDEAFSFHCGVLDWFLFQL